MKGRFLVAVQFGTLAVLAWLALETQIAVQSMVVAGLLGITGLVVIIRAAVDLRSALTVVPEPRQDAPFVTAGIYSVIRHPMYLGVLLLATALVIVAWSYVAAAAFAVLATDLWIKFRYEDSLLRDKWPSASEYQRRVPALLPRLR